MKYLVAGLGNPGPEHENARHNIGYKVLDTLAEAESIGFQDKRYAFIGTYTFKGRTFLLCKPHTFMNRSGLAIRYWMKKEKVPLDKLFVITDDIALPFGTLRIRPKGGDGGHNGLASIIQVLGSREFARLRFGIGDEFYTGGQSNFVLGEWSKEEAEALPSRIESCIEVIKSFGTIGPERTMTQYNR